jgi:adenylate kinase family enzyme
MSGAPRWLEDARIPERMHAQGLPLDMMLSVDRGSDAVVLRVTTRHLTRAEARELGSRLIEAALLAGERGANPYHGKTLDELSAIMDSEEYRRPSAYDPDFADRLANGAYERD